MRPNWYRKIFIAESSSVAPSERYLEPWPSGRQNGIPRCSDSYNAITTGFCGNTTGTNFRLNADNQENDKK